MRKICGTTTEWVNTQTLEENISAGSCFQHSGVIGITAYVSNHHFTTRGGGEAVPPRAVSALWSIKTASISVGVAFRPFFFPGTQLRPVSARDRLASAWPPTEMKWGREDFRALKIWIQLNNTTFDKTLRMEHDWKENTSEDLNKLLMIRKVCINDIMAPNSETTHSSTKRGILTTPLLLPAPSRIFIGHLLH